MTEDEKGVVGALVMAWDLYAALDRPQEDGVFDDDTQDFRKAIHDAQRIIFSFDRKREYLKEIGQ